MSELGNARAGCNNWLNNAPLSCLSLLLNRVAAALDKLQAANREVLQRKGDLVFHLKTSNEQFQGEVTDLIAKINEQAANNVAAARFLCRDRAKLLDAQVDVLSVSVGQLRASVAGGNSAVKQGHLVGTKNAFFAATLVEELCKTKLEPCISSIKLDIVANVYGVLEDLRSMTVLRLYDVDASKSVVSGTGLVSCFRGLGAVNEVKVTCVNTAGKPTEWATVEDVDVFVRSVDGVLIERRISGYVIGKGEIMIKYEVDDVKVDEVGLSVSVGDVTVSGGPWQVAVMRSAVRAEAVHVKTNILNGTDNHGVAVTLDGLYLVVSNLSSHSLSVYSTDSGSCITTFGSPGSGTGQFRGPVRICATPTGTIIVCEYGNKRLQEVTITGEHVRFIGEGHFDIERVYGMCMQGDILAVGRHGGVTNGRILLFSHSSGALIRKFGSYGDGVGEVENVRGLSFTPDGRHILVAQSVPPLLTLFTVDGVFVTRFGCVDDLQSFWKDVLCSGTSVFVVDSFHCRVCAFSAETGALIRSWGTRGEADGQFMFPFALAAHNSKLYVLDLNSPRVQVFE